MPFRPGPSSPYDDEHYAIGHSILLKECETWGDENTIMPWMMAQSDTGSLPRGWYLRCLEAKEGEAQVEEAYAGMSTHPDMDPQRTVFAMLWEGRVYGTVFRFPEPLFTTGVRWVCWVQSAGKTPGYFTLEADVTPETWVVGRWEGGCHKNLGPVEEGTLVSFMTEVENRFLG